MTGGRAWRSEWAMRTPWLLSLVIVLLMMLSAMVTGADPSNMSCQASRDWHKSASFEQARASGRGATTQTSLVFSLQDRTADVAYFTELTGSDCIWLDGSLIACEQERLGLPGRTTWLALPTTRADTRAASEIVVTSDTHGRSRLPIRLCTGKKSDTRYLYVRDVVLYTIVPATAFMMLVIMFFATLPFRKRGNILLSLICISLVRIGLRLALDSVEFWRYGVHLDILLQPVHVFLASMAIAGRNSIRKPARSDVWLLAGTYLLLTCAVLLVMAHVYIMSTACLVLVALASMALLLWRCMQLWRHIGPSANIIVLAAVPLALTPVADVIAFCGYFNIMGLIWFLPITATALCVALGYRVMRHAHTGVEVFKRAVGELGVAIDDAMAAHAGGQSVLMTLAQSDAIRERRQLLDRVEDGFGARMVAVLRMVRARHPDTPVAAEIQRTLVDLRTIVDAIEHPFGTLGEAMASLERRMSPALYATGIEPRWEYASIVDLQLQNRWRMLQWLRCLEEIISNVIQHSKARHFSLTIHHDEGVLISEVRDDGCGMRTDAAMMGHGLQNLKQRMQALGGDVVFSRDSEVGGTCVRMSMPLG